jgi:hypothetical protein
MDVLGTFAISLTVSQIERERTHIKLRFEITKITRKKLENLERAQNTSIHLIYNFCLRSDKQE